MQRIARSKVTSMDIDVNTLKDMAVYLRCFNRLRGLSRLTKQENERLGTVGTPES